MVAAGTGEVLPGRTHCEIAWNSSSYNRCGAGKWIGRRVGVGGGRTTDRAAGQRCRGAPQQRRARPPRWAEIEEYGVDLCLDELAEDLRANRWRPLPARRVLIPKPGTSERRPLSIPSVRDRVVAAAVKIVLEPIFEAEFSVVQFRVPPEALDTRCAASAHRRVLAEQMVGGRDGHRRGPGVS